MIYVSPEIKEEVDELAKRLGTVVPGNIDLVMWPLPLLQALVKRIEELEEKLNWNLDDPSRRP